jgi:hypothetical protein
MQLAGVHANTPMTIPPQLPALVADAVRIASSARRASQDPSTASLEQARGWLEQLPTSLDRIGAVVGLPSGIRWAIEGTRILTTAARAKTDALLALPEDPAAGRVPMHRGLLTQMDLVLERIRNAEQLLRNPW